MTQASLEITSEELVRQRYGDDLKKWTYAQRFRDIYRDDRWFVLFILFSTILEGVIKYLAYSSKAEGRGLEEEDGAWLNYVCPYGEAYPKTCVGYGFYANYGSAGGSFTPGSPTLVLVRNTGILAIAAITFSWIVYFPFQSRSSQRSYALVLSGCIGNLYDRVLLGYVVDYWLFAGVSAAQS